MGAGRALRLTALVATTFAAGLGTQMALAAVLQSPTVPTPTVSVTAPPLPTVTTPTVSVPTLPTTSTPTPTQPPPPPPPAPPTTTSGGTSPPPPHSGGTSPPPSGGASTGSAPGGSAQVGAPAASGSGSSRSRATSRQQSVARSRAHDGTGIVGTDGATASTDGQHHGSADQASGSGTRASHRETSRFTPAAVAGRVSNPLVIVALAAAVLLLGTAALPRGLVPSPRLTVALMEHRVAIAAAGAAALGAAVIALATS